jgi:sulfite reductase alpha subunit-like flavoprotein/glutaredoxin/glutathione S-transferase
MTPWRHPGFEDSSAGAVRGTFRECPFAAKIRSRTRISQDPAAVTRQVTIDINGTGITYHPGDRLAIMPQNTMDDVRAALAALGVEADTEVPIGGEWQIFFECRPTITALRLLRAARLRPLPITTVLNIAASCKAGKGISATKKLTKVMVADPQPHDTDFTIDELITREVWAAGTGMPNPLWTYFDLERPRTYSISSYASKCTEGAPLPDTIDLTVSRQHRRITTDAHVVGTGSGFLNPNLGVAHSQHPDGTSVRVGISRPLLFSLPDSSKPIVMFAGGSGIGPFRSFLQRRCADPLAGTNLLFLGLRNRESIMYEAELAGMMRAGKLKLHVAFSREDVEIVGADEAGFVFGPSNHCYVGALMKRKKNALELWHLMLREELGGLEANFFVCGQVNLFQTVIGALDEITVSRGQVKFSLLRELFSQHRLQSEVYKTPVKLENPIKISASELSGKNSEASGYWIALQNRVYDITEFMDLHPGGMAIIRSNCGLDGSHVFKQVAHDTNAEIMSLLDCYVIGVCSTPKFKSEVVEQLHNSLLTFLTKIVEMENTFGLDAASMSVHSNEDDRASVDISLMQNMLDLHRRVLLVMAPAIFGKELRLLTQECDSTCATHGCDSAGSHEISTFDQLVQTDMGKSALHSLHILNNFGSVKYRLHLVRQRTQLNEYILNLLSKDEEFLSRTKSTIAVALAELETENATVAAVSGCAVQLRKLAKQLGGYFSDITSALKQRYVVSLSGRSGRTLWGCLRLRLKEGCLMLLLTADAVFDVSSRLPLLRGISALQSDADAISRALASSRVAKPSRSRWGGILGRAFCASSLQTAHHRALDKQLCRIVTVLKRTSNGSASKAVTVEFIKGIFLNLMSGRSTGHHLESSINSRGSIGNGDRSDTVDDTAVGDSRCKFTVYSQAKCGYSSAAVNLLRSEKVALEVIETSSNPALRAMLVKRSHHRSFPQVYIGRRFIGGFSELRAIHAAGLLHTVGTDCMAAQDDARLARVDETGMARELVLADVDSAMQRKGLPDDARAALLFLKQLFADTPEMTSIGFDAFSYAWLSKGNTDAVEVRREVVKRASPSGSTGATKGETEEPIGGFDALRPKSRDPSKAQSSIAHQPSLNSLTTPRLFSIDDGEATSLGREGSDIMVLYAKSWTGSPEKLGDCPFTQSVHMALVAMRARYKVILVDLDNIQPWFINISPTACTPVIGHRGVAIEDSAHILEYLADCNNFNLPGTANDPDAERRVCVRTAPNDDIHGKLSGCFFALVKLLKNDDEDNDPELKLALVAKLEILNDECPPIPDSQSPETADGTSTGRFICGEHTLTIADCLALPALYHIMVAGRLLKGFEIPPTLSSLLAYIEHGFRTREWLATKYSESAVLDGWAEHMGCGA